MKRILLISLSIILFTSLFAQQKVDSPRMGEGISAFLERNGLPGRGYYRAFLQLNAKLLRGKEELRMGVKYQLPDDKRGSKPANNNTSTTRKLFGSRYKKVEVTGNSLKGACFYVVSGHGGPDPGAIGRVGGHELHEDEYAYDVALRLARLLIQEGAEVRIIIQDEKDGIRSDRYLQNSKRETCMGDKIPLNQLERLQQRCEKINALYASDRKRFSYCRAVFLHVDSRSKREQTDVFFYHAPKSVKGLQLSRTMKDTFEGKYNKHQPNRGFEGTVSERNLFVLRTALPVALFVELGNIQNSYDQRRFVLSDNRQALAKWMMEGFIADYRNAL